jgi:hypothetical protein
MKSVTLYIRERKYLNALLRNSKFIESNVDVLTIEEIETILLKNNIILKSGNYNLDNSDVIITDDIDVVKLEKVKPIIFLHATDYNSITGYINHLKNTTPAALNDLEYIEKYHNNLYFIAPLIIDNPHIIFDLSYTLNYNLYDSKWGNIHYSAKDLFFAIERKPFRIDYTVREVKKINRIKLFLDLIESGFSSKLKISIHGNFITDENLNAQVKEFFKRNELSEYFDKIVSLNSVYYNNDSINGEEYLHQDWPVNKLLSNTLKSDIALYFESGPELEEWRPMDNLITEKTIDLLSIGKPFIYINDIVKTFNVKYKFIDYNRTIFDEISTDKIELVKIITDMGDREYTGLLNSLREIVVKNSIKLEKYKKNNTLLEKIIDNSLIIN